MRTSSKKWKALCQGQKNLPNANTVVTNDPMETTYVGIHMWKQAVERKAKTTDVDKVIAATGGQKFSAPDGYTIRNGQEQPPPAQTGLHR